MRTTITTGHGTYTGRTIESIVHREYGRRAFPSQSSDPNSTHWGEVLEPPTDYDMRHGVTGYNVLAIIHAVEQTD